MRIVMLGWEFPPFVSGGLGTACQGLTRAIDALGHDILFVLPRALDTTKAGPEHVRVLGAMGRVMGKGETLLETKPLTMQFATEPGTGRPMGMGPMPDSAGPSGGAVGSVPGVGRAMDIPGFERAEFFSVPASVTSPYPGGDFGGGAGSSMMTPISMDDAATPGLPSMAANALRAAGVSEHALRGSSGSAWSGAGDGYGPDVVGDTERYAKMVLELVAGRGFDVIHAHDWMSFPAGIALSRLTGKPLVAHVHSTEFDRSGEHVNQAVYDIERRGAHAADHVIAVSKFTRDLLVTRYGVAHDRISVVYNGVEGEPVDGVRELRASSEDKIVLFLGRITMQKGPEYFVRAARRVLEKHQNVKFVVAGSGDMAKRMVEEAAFLGIGHRMLFTGFLRGDDVDRAFRMADCYVMPSVSEPFGIAPLEAMRNDVPVIISKQSGVSEVLTHALKVDFWDIDEMANQILAVIRRPALGQTLRENSSHEVRTLTWETAAKRVVASYGSAIAAAANR